MARVALISTLKRHSSNMLVLGEKWVGKSSFALAVQEMAANIPSLAGMEELEFRSGVYTFGACASLDHVCLALIDTFRKLVPDQSKVIELLSSIRGIKVGLLGLELAERERPEIRLQLSPLVLHLLRELAPRNQAFLVVLDETERLASFEGAAHLLKDFMETLSREGQRQVMFLFTATPNGERRLREDHPSFPRQFRYIQLDRMTIVESMEQVDS
ncbi:MAG: hypothetical protein NTW26_07130 [bacterium]|nr:hypothetical protein [bacterium]